MLNNVASFWLRRASADQYMLNMQAKQIFFPCTFVFNILLLIISPSQLPMAPSQGV